MNPAGRIFILSSLVASLGCGAGGYSSGPPDRSALPNSVTVSNDAFSPRELIVSAGTTVTWVWDSCTGDQYGARQTCTSHNVTFDAATHKSSTQSSGTYARTFDTAGVYQYQCTIHGEATGRVVVQ